MASESNPVPMSADEAVARRAIAEIFQSDLFLVQSRFIDQSNRQFATDQSELMGGVIAYIGADGELTHVIFPQNGDINSEAAEEAAILVTHYEENIVPLQQGITSEFEDPTLSEQFPRYFKEATAAPKRVGLHTVAGFITLNSPDYEYRISGLYIPVRTYRDLQLLRRDLWVGEGSEHLQRSSDKTQPLGQIWGDEILEAVRHYTTAKNLPFMIGATLLPPLELLEQEL
ncbi:MAG: hypothetical protein V4702_05265 [Patescibacteria group bacterium]